jgi:uncharacterized membrane protein HdeD (DUF308 family)
VLRTACGNATEVKSKGPTTMPYAWNHRSSAWSVTSGSAPSAVAVVVVFWVIGLISYTRALVLGTVSRVTAVFLVTEVHVPGIVAVVLLGDTVRPGWWVPLTIGLLLAVAGVIVLAHSPAQAPPRPRRVR